MPRSWEDRVLRLETKGTCTLDGSSLTTDVTESLLALSNTRERP